VHKRIDDLHALPLRATLASGLTAEPFAERGSGCTLIDVKTSAKTLGRRLAALAISFILMTPAAMRAQSDAASASPPENAGIFPLTQIRPGMMATAWTVFEGTKPEPMQVKILGVLRGARGPGQDMILARLVGAKPEYTGVVAGMSGSPVYIDGKLAGSLSYRIGLFAKEPIAGITPIEQMLEVRDLAPRDLAQSSPLDGKRPAARTLSAEELVASNTGSADSSPAADKMTFKPMDTPLVMSGFHADAIRLWQQHTAGSSLETVAVGGMGGSAGQDGNTSRATPKLVPGSAVSMQLVRGDLEISATCTVTYVDPKQLLACGHPVLEAGPVSLPMTTAEVVTTLASPLEAFKIVNTGATVGAFTQDRESAIRGVFGAEAHMIPMHIAVDAPEGPRKVNVEILDLPSLSPLAMEVVLFEALLETNESSEALSYHLTGNFDLAGFPSVPLDEWAAADSGFLPAPLMAAFQAGEEFNRLYSNGARQGGVRQIDLHIEALPRHVQVTLEQAHVVSNNVVHAGDTVEVEATLRPWQEPERNVRIAVKLPARLGAGNLRLLVSDGATLDRTLQQPHLAPGAPPADLATVLAEARNQHAADRIYVSVLAPETQGEINGQTLTSLPLSMANALEPLRNAQTAGLNGESAEVAGEAPAGGVLSGAQILSLHIEPGGGLD
jgi:hypothetical protein